MRPLMVSVPSVIIGTSKMIPVLHGMVASTPELLLNPGTIPLGQMAGLLQKNHPAVASTTEAESIRIVIC